MIYPDSFGVNIDPQGLLYCFARVSLGALLAVQGITPAITSELFGLQNFATNYAIVQMGPALGMLAYQCAMSRQA